MIRALLGASNSTWLVWVLVLLTSAELIAAPGRFVLQQKRTGITCLAQTHNSLPTGNIVCFGLDACLLTRAELIAVPVVVYCTRSVRAPPAQIKYTIIFSHATLLHWYVCWCRYSC
jgi:hypothetical protein